MTDQPNWDSSEWAVFYRGRGFVTKPMTYKQATAIRRRFHKGAGERFLCSVQSVNNPLFKEV